MFKRIYRREYLLYTFTFLLSILQLDRACYAQAVSGDSIVYLSLQEAIDLGLANSFRLKAAKQDVLIGHENIAQQKTDRLPDINIGIDGYLINDPTLYNGEFFTDPVKVDYTPFQLSGNLVASQVIYAGSRVKNSINQQVLQKNIAEFAVEKTSAEVKLAIINEYLKLYTLYKDYEVNVQTINQIELRLNTLRSKLKNGQVVKNDVSRSELQKSDYELKLLGTISEATVTNYLLTLLLGISENAVIQVDTSSTYVSDTLFVFSDILHSAFNNRPEYQIVKTNKALSENSLRLIKGTYFPTVNGIGLYGLQNPVPGTFPPEGKFLALLTVGVGINYNLGSLYKFKHQKLSAELAVQREDDNIRDLEITLSDQVKTQYMQYEFQRQSLRIYVDKIRFAEENYRIVKSRYYNDLALISDIVDAEREYNEARIELVKGQVRTRLNYYQLLKAIGQL